MVKMTHLDEQTLKHCARDIHSLVLLPNIDEKARLTAVFEKFKSPKYGAVSYKIQQRAYRRSSSQKAKQGQFGSNQESVHTSRHTPSGKK